MVGLVDGGVAQHEPRDLSGETHIGVEQPFNDADRDRATPIVGQENHPTTHVAGPDDRCQIVHPIRQAAREGTARGVAHPHLIHGQHTDTRWCTRKHAAPQIRPGRIAVDAHDRESGVARPGIQHVDAKVRTILIAYEDDPRPIGIEPR